MPDKDFRQPAPQHRPNQDTDPNQPASPAPVRKAGGERRGVETHIADADKIARTGESEEKVRNTPPFGDFDTTVGDAKDDAKKKSRS